MSRPPNPYEPPRARRENAQRVSAVPNFQWANVSPNRQSSARPRPSPPRNANAAGNANPPPTPQPSPNQQGASASSSSSSSAPHVGSSSGSGGSAPAAAVVANQAPPNQPPPPPGGSSGGAVVQPVAPAAPAAVPRLFDAMLTEDPSIHHIRLPERRDVEVSLRSYQIVEYEGEGIMSFLTLEVPDAMHEEQSDSIQYFRFLRQRTLEVQLPASLVSELQGLIQCRHDMNMSSLMDVVAESCKNIMSRVNASAFIEAQANNYAPIISYYMWKTTHGRTNATTQNVLRQRWYHANEVRANVVLLAFSPFAILPAILLITTLMTEISRAFNGVSIPYLQYGLDELASHIVVPILVETFRRLRVTTRGLRRQEFIQWFNTAVLYVIWIMMMLAAWTLDPQSWVPDPGLSRDATVDFICCLLPYWAACLVRMLYAVHADYHIRA